MIPNSIGLICEQYVAASELAGDQATDFSSGLKRKVCPNRECATRRLAQPVKVNAKRVSMFIKTAADTLLERLVFNLKHCHVLFQVKFRI
jgi:hypothetical protein